MLKRFQMLNPNGVERSDRLRCRFQFRNFQIQIQTFENVGHVMGQQVFQNGKRQRLVRQSDVNVFNQILVQLDQLDADNRLEDSGDVP